MKGNDIMMISKKFDNFINELNEKFENVSVRVDLDSNDKEFNNYTIIVNSTKSDKRYVFKVYDKRHMSSIGEFCYKFFKTQNEMIEYIMSKVVE